MAAAPNRKRSRSFDEQPTQPRADRGRFGSLIANRSNRTSLRSSTAPTREWLTDALAYKTLYNELVFLSVMEPRTKLSLVNGRSGDTRDAWKETLRGEGVKLMENIALVKRISLTAMSNVIKASHVLCASLIMRRTRLKNASASRRLMPTHDMSDAQRSNVVRSYVRLEFPEHASGELDWKRWSAVCGMKGASFARLAHAVFGREMNFSAKAKRVFVRHLRGFIEAIVPVIAQYARESDHSASGERINRELIERAANCAFSG